MNFAITKNFNNRNLKKIMNLYINHIVIINIYKVFESKIRGYKK